MAKAIRFFELNTGAKIPSVGLGTWQAEPGVVAKAVTTAIQVGYRHIDCAQAYFNQAEIGAALKKLFDDGVVKREDLWITSKLWCSDHAPEDVPKALDKTLQDLQLDYLDLYLIHWPVCMKKGSVRFKPENLDQHDIPNTWRAMEALFDSGKARAIGVSNFSSKKLQDLLAIARIPPAANQVELHPSWQQPKLHSFCESKGIHLSGYSPLGSPGNLKSDILKNPVVNMVAEKLGKSPAQVALRWGLQMGHSVLPKSTNEGYSPLGSPGNLKSDILKNPVVNMVAEKLGKSPAQVALRWGLQMGHSVLPKSTNEARIKDNFDVFDWSIPEELIAKFSEINQERLIKGTGFVHETYGAYKTVEELWDGEL